MLPRERGRPLTAAAETTSGNPRKRAPELGFMSLRGAIVRALSAQGLRWGAIDFGGESGDIMHFDALNSPLGSAIMRALMAEAQAAGLPVRLMVASDGEAARRFYLRLGFVPTRTLGFYAELEWRAPAAS